jgi:SAM-dependent methyltransferase
MFETERSPHSVAAVACDHRRAMRSDDLMGVSQAWEENAEQWPAWARTPEHDVYFWQLNLPAFVQLLPAAGWRTVDVGCGESRVGRWLAEAGHRVIGIDRSPTLGVGHPFSRCSPQDERKCRSTPRDHPRLGGSGRLAANVDWT